MMGVIFSSNGSFCVVCLMGVKFAVIVVISFPLDV